MNKTLLGANAAAILRGNDGASLVLASIIAIIIISGVIILRMTTTTLWASADKQLNQDRAYEVATSLGHSIDEMIVNNSHAPQEYVTSSPVAISELPDARVEVTVAQTTTTDNTYYILKVHAYVANAEYTYTATYYAVGGGSTAIYKRAY